jgi:uncharacterized protein (DUF342 family)
MRTSSTHAHRRDIQHKLCGSDYSFLVHEGIDTLSEAYQRLQEWDEISQSHPKGRTASLARTITGIIERWEAMLPKDPEAEQQDVYNRIFLLEERIDMLQEEKIALKKRAVELMHELNEREARRELQVAS